jgi:type II secretory pathway predicted ATPase ExeA
MYYEYWGLNKPPFDNVPDPSMYVESHSSVETAVAETLFAIEEGNECVAVIVGDVGSGKTLSLRLILDSLNQDSYRIAMVTNPDMSFVELLKEIIGQITGKECETKRRLELLEVFNKLLFESADAGKKVLIFIDEANAMSGPNLESLRLLTNMQDDNRNLFTLVLAGQIELAKRLEHPRRANLYQRIGTYNRIEKIESIERLKDYVQTRLKLAGATQAFFTDGAFVSLWKHSERGVPRLVNKICKLCLKAGETNGFRIVDERTVTQIGERFSRLSVSVEAKEGSQTATNGPRTTEKIPPMEVNFPAREVIEQAEEREARRRPVTTAQAKVPPAPPMTEQPEQQEMSWETDIGSFHIRIAIPPDVLQQVDSSPSDIRTKIAGSLAAQTLQKYPQLAFSSSHDPVALWSDIRRAILTAMEQHTRALAAG